MRLTSKDTLRALMQQRGMSLQDVANFATVSKGFISHLTAGRKNTCQPRVAEAIARCLDVPLEVLFVPLVSSAEGYSVKYQRRVA